METTKTIVAKIEKLKTATIPISSTSEIGLPFSRSFWRPTPKFWRVIGDALSGLGTLGVIIGIKNPVFAIVCGVSGWVGKLITNSISTTPPDKKAIIEKDKLIEKIEKHIGEGEKQIEVLKDSVK